MMPSGKHLYIIPQHNMSDSTLNKNGSDKESALSEGVDTENDFDSYENQLRTIFSLDKAKLESLAEAFNKYGANISLDIIAKITGDAKGIIYLYKHTLGYIIHGYLHHRKSFDKEKSETKIEPQLLEALEDFIKKLDKKGLDGLNLSYAARESFRGWMTFDGLASGGVQLKEIVNDTEEILGLLPFVRARLTLTDENEKKSTPIVYLSLDEVAQLMYAFRDMYETGVKAARRHQKFIGEAVIVPAGEGD